MISDEQYHALIAARDKLMEVALDETGDIDSAASVLVGAAYKLCSLEVGEFHAANGLRILFDHIVDAGGDHG